MGDLVSNGWTRCYANRLCEHRHRYLDRILCPTSYGLIQLPATSASDVRQRRPPAPSASDVRQRRPPGTSASDVRQRRPPEPILFALHVIQDTVISPFIFTGVWTPSDTSVWTRFDTDVWTRSDTSVWTRSDIDVWTRSDTDVWTRSDTGVLDTL